MKKVGVIEIVDSDEDEKPSTSKRLRIAEETATLNEDSSPAASLQISTKATPRQRNRRKSTHQPLRASPDMHFETITLDDDVNNTNNSDNANEEANAVQKESKLAKVTVKGSKSLDIFDATALLDVWPKDTVQTIKDIAEERVRINYMLEAFGMTPINFTLDESLIDMKEVFLQRLKARNILQGLNADINLIENLQLI